MSITVNSVAEDWEVYDLSVPNRSALARPAHTSKEPALVIFSRVLPVVKDGDAGLATGVIKIVNGDLDTDGLPLARNSLIEIRFREPQDHGDDVMTDQRHVLDAIVAHASLIPDLLKGILPTAAI